MEKPSECHKLTSDNNIIKFKKQVNDPFNALLYNILFKIFWVNNFFN